MMKPAANQQLYRLACQGPLTNPGVFMFGAQITRFPQVNLNLEFLFSNVPSVEWGWWQEEQEERW